jgi:NAD-dependent DNA ligase
MQTILTNTDEMLQLFGIGKKIVDTLQAFFSYPQTQQLLQQLQAYGLRFSAVQEEKQPQEIVGTFSITGSFPVSREQIREVLEKN